MSDGDWNKTTTKEIFSERKEGERDKADNLIVNSLTI